MLNQTIMEIVVYPTPPEKSEKCVLFWANAEKKVQKIPDDLTRIVFISDVF